MAFQIVAIIARYTVPAERRYQILLSDDWKASARQVAKAFCGALAL